MTATNIADILPLDRIAEACLTDAYFPELPSHSGMSDGADVAGSLTVLVSDVGARKRVWGGRV